MSTPNVYAEKRPWDAECDATRVGLERFMRALVMVRGHFTDSMTLGSIAKPTRAVTVFFRVWIPEGLEARFVELAKIRELTNPPRVSV